MSEINDHDDLPPLEDASEQGREKEVKSEPEEKPEPTEGTEVADEPEPTDEAAGSYSHGWIDVFDS